MRPGLPHLGSRPRRPEALREGPPETEANPVPVSAVGVAHNGAPIEGHDADSAMLWNSLFSSLAIFPK
jgi:hypothetical protein